MNSLFGPVLAIVGTALLLLLREFILSVGKKKSDSPGMRSEEHGFPGSEVQVKERLHAVPTRQLEEPIPDAASIGVDEFLTELRAKSREQGSPSKSTNVPETGLARDQHNRTHMVGHWR